MVEDTAEPSGFWTWTHTEMSWTDVDTGKLPDGKSVPLRGTCSSSVRFLDTVLILKHKKQNFI